MRANRALKAGNKERSIKIMDYGLESLALTIVNYRGDGLKEVLIDFYYSDNYYMTTMDGLQKYFDEYALVIRG